LPTVFAGNDQTVCSGDTVVLIGSGATSYSWNNGAVNNSGFVAQATQTYTLTGIDINLCQNTDQITINVNPTPTVSAGIDTSICAGASFILTGVGASSYSWNNGVTNGVSFIPASTATYTLTGTNAFGCDDQDQIAITVNSLPTINVGPNATICEGDSIVLQATGALSYSWNNGQANGAVIYPTQPSSSYSVVGVDANNCQGTATLLVSANPLPVVNTISDTLVCDYNVPVQLNVLGNASLFTWSNGTVGYSISISQAGTYTVTGELNGCTDSSSIVVVLDACLGIYEEDLFALSYYPNPTQKEVYVSFNMPISATISILTMDGRVLFIDQLINQSETILNFSSIATGPYLIKLDQNGDTNLIKVIKE